MKQKTKQVRIPAEEYGLLKKYAAKVERTLTTVIARAIRQYVGDAQ